MTEYTNEDASMAAEGDHEDFTVIDKGTWEVDYKDYSYRTVIVQHNETGKYFKVEMSRGGSYYTEYYYENNDLVEVKKVEKQVTVTNWEVV